MNVSFIKQMKDLEKEVLLKSVELDDDGDDFQFELFDRYAQGSQDYYYATVGEIFDYADAVKKIEITKNIIKNPTERDVYALVDGKKIVIKAGTIYHFEAGF